MEDQTGSETNLSLLIRLRSGTQDAATWDEFVNRYGPKIHRWCCHWGLQPADAEDVTQNVLLALSNQMRTFEYRADGRFRSWLKTVAYRAWCRFHEQRKRNAAATADDSVRRLLESLEAREDFLREIDRECERDILEHAMRYVKSRVKANTWTAFYETALESRAAANVGEELGLSVVAVYQARSRVQAMIKKEVAQLEKGDVTVD
ncbi:MAG: sigma-70 family RNA polymerase sigma factor [Planctomycetota bacterium]